MVKRIVTLACFLIISSRIWAETPFRLSTGDHWPPYVSSDLKHYGLYSRITTEAFKLVGVEVEYDFYPWARSVKMAKLGKADGTGFWVRSPERERDFYFSDPIHTEVMLLYHHKSYLFDWDTLEDLKGIHIGVTRGYSYGEEFDNAVKSGELKVQIVRKDELNFKKILAGRIDIFPYNKRAGYYMLRQLFQAEDAILLTYHQKPISSFTLHLLFSKNIESKRYLKLFNEGLKRLKASGKYDQYLSEYK